MISQRSSGADTMPDREYRVIVEYRVLSGTNGNELEHEWTNEWSIRAPGLATVVERMRERLDAAFPEHRTTI